MSEKKKNKTHKVLSKKMLLLLFAIVIVVAAGIILVTINNKKKDKDDITVSELDYVMALEKEDEVEAAKAVKNNLVRVINKIDDETKIVGTGFFIKEGYLLTNSHVVDIFGEITVEYNDQSTSKAYLYSNSIEYDIALLKVEDVKAKALLFGDSSSIEVTNSVLAAGYAFNFAGEASISKGILSARRELNEINYLQSDLSIDTGSSGGPMFTPKAEVVGLNTYVTENRSFTLSLSSESLNMILPILLESPNIEYLTEDRPSNNINKILVEVRYTDNLNLELFNDKIIINKSKQKYKKELDNLENTENVSVVNSEAKKKDKGYYCDDGFTLVGLKCVRKETYLAGIEYANCKEGYVKENNQCTKTTIVDAEVTYPCYSGTLNADNQCVEKTLEVGSGESYKKRWGSCPSGKTCYDMGNSHYTNTTNKKFISSLVCPNGATKTSESMNFVWNGEEINESNIKRYNTSTPGATIQYDADGTVYYTDVSNVLSMCVKETDSNTGVKVLYTYDELKNIACPNGGTFTANTNNQGFYCLISTKIHMYAWDPVCNHSAYSWIPYLDTYYCGRYIEEAHDVAPVYSCKDGTMRSDQKTCAIYDTYYLDPIYKCSPGDISQGSTCMKTIIVDAKKK